MRGLVGTILALAMIAVGAGPAAAAAPAPGAIPLFEVTNAQSRSISPENPTGERGGGARLEAKDGSASYAAAELGKGWKVNPYVNIAPGTTYRLGEAAGPGIINHVWMTLGGLAEYRSAILRIYWDDEATPSVEAPVGDFFAAGWGRGAEPVIDSAMVAVNPGSGFNSFWQMPFRKKFRMTIENRSSKILRVYYQINYALEPVSPRAGYFHAQFRMANPLKAGDVYTILDGVRGQGQYVGTYLGHGAFSPGWWGEGEVKFYMDGDQEYPTIAGTGEEDYFLGSYIYVKRGADGRPREVNYASLYSGFYALKPAEVDADYFRADGERRHGEYRWHVLDPIRFQKDLKVTIQNLGWKDATPTRVSGNGRYLALSDSLASVAYWYQLEPHAPFPALPSDAVMQIPPARGTAAPAVAGGAPGLP
ncbi:glycoside hydrolase family 172 protein [Phenylobacterium sp.]|uniref:glycoside hydrolase family 172 protein n=1 Tax=Phenylobacterium sp. TaxID=1871053 RepID=UPI0025D225B5|nr:glycoside hydrolase family 172 protein [Phenylobacterium sp.]